MALQRLSSCLSWSCCHKVQVSRQTRMYPWMGSAVGQAVLVLRRCNKGVLAGVGLLGRSCVCKETHMNEPMITVIHPYLLRSSVGHNICVSLGAVCLFVRCMCMKSGTANSLDYSTASNVRSVCTWGQTSSISFQSHAMRGCRTVR